MKLLTVPPVPLSIRYDFVAAVRFEEICQSLIDLDKLCLSNVSSVEVAALAYSRWLECEDKTAVEGYDSPSATHAHRYRTSYFVALSALGLARTERDAKDKVSAKPAKKPAPIRVDSVDEPIESTPSKRLRIYGA